MKRRGRYWWPALVRAQEMRHKAWRVAGGPDDERHAHAVAAVRRDADEPSALRSSVLSLYVAGVALGAGPVSAREV